MRFIKMIPEGAITRYFFFLLILLAAACQLRPEAALTAPIAIDSLSDGVRLLIESARKQTRITTGYTQKYYVIPYPGGDVPEETGACTDVVIRAFRNAGIDLQKEVHEDMSRSFASYPRKWDLTRPDTNIDHRRVPNLMTFFERKGRSLPVSSNPEDYLPGDVVTWDLDDNGTTHIGLVSDVKNGETGAPLIFHNIGGGARLEDRLFDWTITGRYRWFEGKK